MLRRTRSLPGVRAAGLADVLPFAGDRSWSVSVEGRSYEKNRHPEPYIRVVTDGYFEAAGIPLRAGRWFTEGDHAASQPVVIINETMARTAFPGEGPLGQMITTYRGDKVLGVVVGVVADVRHSALEEVSGPETYQEMRQTDGYSARNLVVRTVIPADQLAPAVRAALRPIDPNLPLSEFRPLQDLVAKAVSPLGIRMALGASAANLQSRMVLHTLGLAVAGLALGMAGSLVLTGMLQSFLFGVSSEDPITFVGIGASRIDPVALRSN